VSKQLTSIKEETHKKRKKTKKNRVAIEPVNVDIEEEPEDIDV